LVIFHHTFSLSEGKVAGNISIFKLNRFRWRGLKHFIAISAGIWCFTSLDYFGRNDKAE